MLELNAEAFFSATTQLRHVTTLIEGLKLGATHPQPSKAFGTPVNDAQFLGDVAANCNLLNQSLDALGAQISRMAVDECLSSLAGAEKPSLDELKGKFDEIGRTIRRELSQRRLLVIASADQDLYQPAKPLFGSDFAAKFPTHGAFELDEAAKCLALGRPTAAAFHLMRLLEIGIRTMHLCLGGSGALTGGDRNWGSMLKAMRTSIDTKWPTVASKSHGDGQIFDSLYASFDAVRNPWRNSTMHVELKYTDDEARHIFGAVRGFVIKIAARMDENGERKA
jgi:hypothetical protein